MINLKEFFILSFAVSFLSFISVSKGHILNRLCNYIIKKIRFKSFRDFLIDLISCPICIGFYYSLLVVGIYIFVIRNINMIFYKKVFYWLVIVIGVDFLNYLNIRILNLFSRLVMVLGVLEKNLKLNLMITNLTKRSKK